MAHDPQDAPPQGAQVAEDKRIDSLEQRIAHARAVEEARTGHDKALMGQAQSSATQVASTMVGYPLGGIVIGYFLDRMFGTLPWITIALMFLAFFGACIHVVRMNKDSGASAD